MSQKKVADDWEDETSSDSDDDEDELSDSDDDALDEMMRNVNVGGGRDFNVFQQGGHGKGQGAAHNGKTPQPPKHLKGAKLGEWWRNYGKAKARENKDGLDSKERRRLKLEKREAKKDPKLLPSLYLNQLQSKQIDEAVANYRQYLQEKKSAKVSKSILPSPTVMAAAVAIPATVDADDAESAGLGEDEYEEWQDYQCAASQTTAPAPVVVDPTAYVREESKNMAFMAELADKQSDPAYLEMMKLRRRLPAWQARKELLKTVRENQVTVVSGETGCGKTTQLPQFILDSFMEEGNGVNCRIVCTQPRRISAISVAERIAKERAERLGKSVGYQIRLEKALPRTEASILFCTTGILLQWLSGNRLLNGISHIIVDEIHEQDILSDFLLIILKDLRTQRPDLRIILMSATINAEKFCAYFDGCPLINIPGFTHPVEVLFLEDILARTNYSPADKQVVRRKLQRNNDPEWERFMVRIRSKYSKKTLETLEEFDEGVIDFNLIMLLIRHIVKTTPEQEAILIFLPGWDDIKKLNTLAESTFGGGRPSRFLIIPLHSMMPTMNQRQVFERPDKQRKIVIATSIAETSITIDDVVHVIDTGKIKMKDFDVERNLSTLTAQWVSVSNAKQRKGRAGRVKSGVCYHLFTSYQYNKLEQFPLPEMKRTRLDELCLQLKMLNLGMVEPFVQKAMEPPKREAVVQAVELLTLIGALDDNEALTPLGHLLAQTPVPPQLGKMLFLGCIFGCLDPILNITAVLSFRDPFCTPLGKEEEARRTRNNFGRDSSGRDTKSDHLLLDNAVSDFIDSVVKHKVNINDYCWQNFMFPSTCLQILKMKKQFAHILYSTGFIQNVDYDPSANKNRDEPEIIRAVLCAGLYPNLGTMKRAKNKNQAPPVETSNEEKTCVHPKSIFGRHCQEEGIVAFFSQIRTSQIFIHDVTLMSSNLPVVLFCKRTSMSKKSATNVVSVDGWLELRTVGTGTYQQLEKLRQTMSSLLLEIYQDKLFNLPDHSRRELPPCIVALIRLAEDLFRFRSTA
ncbi:ATP-dependent RNA helicase DHX36 [Hypsibius exemplaris]|uniref:RNA helicase n=1 Tax=Hypsibius exemplaris TaxID=2072580 RepID=A0A9X6NB04_HYPEX|nr:ATP-dependent RNA helicase DHX36 [Hypsibius exemplaris]